MTTECLPMGTRRLWRWAPNALISCL